MAGEPSVPAPVRPPATRIYRAIEVIDGRDVVRYTNRKPGT